MKKILYIFGFYIFLTSNVLALIKVDITRGNLDPLPIAVSPLYVDDASEKISNIDIKNLGSNISRII